MEPVGLRRHCDWRHHLCSPHRPGLHSGRGRSMASCQQTGNDGPARRSQGGNSSVAHRGLDIGKWLHNIGSIGIMAAYVILLGLPLWALLRGTITHYEPIPWQPPRPSWFGLAIFGQMTVGALSGFEYVAILAGESRNAARTIGQSEVISAPIIALMFILGTSSVLTFLGSQPINVIGPIPQTMRNALGAVGWAAPLAISLLMMRAVASASLIFTGLTRLPMTAGWDNL